MPNGSLSRSAGKTIYTDLDELKSLCKRMNTAWKTIHHYPKPVQPKDSKSDSKSDE